jgi:hypothetical protein
MALREHFGELLLPLFTPPWNRCTDVTPPLLVELGFAALSRDRGAKPAQQALQEIAVDSDWSKHWCDGGAPAVAADLARALHERAADGQPLGLMLHHAVMTAEELALLESLLATMAAHPRVRWRAMRELLAASTGTSAPSACTANA